MIVVYKPTNMEPPTYIYIYICLYYIYMKYIHLQTSSWQDRSDIAKSTWKWRILFEYSYPGVGK